MTAFAVVDGDEDFGVTTMYGNRLSASRVYSSGFFFQANEDGDTMFGPKWHSPYEMQIMAFPDEIDPDGWIFIDERASWHHFVTYDSGSGVWQSRLDQGRPHTLEITSSPTQYIVTRADRSQLVFDANKRLVSIDPDPLSHADESVTLEYDSASPPRLSKVHAAGTDDRYLEFVYHTVSGYERQVATIVFGDSSASQVVSYYIYDAYGRLAYVKLNDITSDWFTQYEYGSYTGSSWSGDSSFRLGRISIWNDTTKGEMRAYRWEYAPWGQWHPAAEYVNDPDSPGWHQKFEVNFSLPMITATHESGGTNGPTMYITANWKRDVEQVTYANTTTPVHAVAMDPPSGYSDNDEGTPRLFGAKLGNYNPTTQTFSETLSEATYNLASSSYLDKYLNLSSTKYYDSSNGITRTFTYDTTFTWKLKTASAPDSETVTYTYDTDFYTSYPTLNPDYSKLVSVTVGGQSTTYEYNANGLLAVVTDPYGNETEYTYNSRGEVSNTYYPNGLEVTTSYDDFGNVLTQRDEHLDNVTTYTYSNQLSTSDPQYSVIPRLIEIEYPDSSTTEYEYDATGRPVTVTDPLLNETNFTYDGRYRLETVTNAEAETVEYEYDEFDRMVTFIDGRGKETDYSYDEFGRQTRETDHDGYYFEYTYSGDSSGGCGCNAGGTGIKRIRRKDGTFITLGYDYMARLTGVDYESIGTSGSEEIEYAYDDAGRVLSVTDSRLTIGNTYTFTYDDGTGSGVTGRLLSVQHPDGYLQEFFYDDNDQSGDYRRLVAYKDVDGNIVEYEYDSLGRVGELTDTYGDATSWTFSTTSDSAYPVGSLKQQIYGNGTKNVYTYDSLGRLDKVEFKDPGNSVFDLVDLAYNSGGLITQKARAAYTTYYDYDDAYRLTQERVRAAGGGSDKWKRDYTYDDAGNRASMTYWNDQSINQATTYTYGNRNQLTANGSYHVDGTTLATNFTYSFDSNGNMTDRNYSVGDPVNWDYSWNEDDRLVGVLEWIDQDPYVSETYAYDSAGQRVLSRAGSRIRHYFNGLTEEVRKVSVPGAHNDGAFAFQLKEDGESVSEWLTAGITVTGGIDDSARRSDVMLLSRGSGLEFRDWPMIGDNKANTLNPNDTPWSSTKRTASLWYRGGADLRFYIETTGAVERSVYYFLSNGTSGLVSNNVHIYLGAGAQTSSWTRFERDVAADFEAYSSETWAKTHGLAVQPQTSPLDTVHGSKWFPFYTYYFYLDDLRLSNSLTVEHNVLGPGVIGHILRNRKIDAGTYSKVDSWFHYDQVGSVMAVSDDAGDDTLIWQDSWGNPMPNWSSGHWQQGVGRWGHNSKEIEAGTDLTYMYQRWYLASIGGFASASPYPANREHPYTFAVSDPMMLVDPNGEFPIATCGIGAVVSIGAKWLGRWKSGRKHKSDCHAVAETACVGIMGCLSGALLKSAGMTVLERLKEALERANLFGGAAALSNLAAAGGAGLIGFACKSPCEWLADQICSPINSLVTNMQRRNKQIEDILERMD